MRIIYRPIEAWPGSPTEHRKTMPFRAGWADTLRLLNRELDALAVKADPVLQLALSEADLRLDGTMRVNAKLRHPGIILSFEHPRHGPLSYPCDTFDGGRHWVSAKDNGGKSGWRQIEGWQANVRAVALSLEALRQVDRYGVAAHGQQYTGWKALPAGVAMPPASMTVEQAARFVAAHTDATPPAGPACTGRRRNDSTLTAAATPPTSAAEAMELLEA